MCLKINRSVKTPWHRPSMGVARSGLWAPENSQHFTMPPLVFQRNDVSRTNAEVPCWWRVTTLIFWLVEANFQPIHSENSGGVATCRLFTEGKRAYCEGEFSVSPRASISKRGHYKCSAFDMEMIFHSHANKTLFHNKSCALGLILKVRVFGTRKRPNSFCLKLNSYNDLLLEKNLDCS